VRPAAKAILLLPVSPPTFSPISPVVVFVVVSPAFMVRVPP